MVSEISISRILCDFVVLAVVAIPLLIFHEFIQPYKKGFYCDDDSLRYPFRKSTVSRQKLIVIGILIPSMLILLTEMLRALSWERRISSQFGAYSCRRYNVHRLIVRLYVFLGYFFLGVCFNQLMVDIAKYTIGRQRPHFMEVCKPNRGYSDCSLHLHEYITEFNCTGKNPYLIHEAQLSFYSGHSAFSFYAAWYTTLYLQARLYKPLYSRLVLPVVQFGLFAGATYVAYTRVSDYKHHWSDVLIGIMYYMYEYTTIPTISTFVIGAAMGSAIGIINALCVAEVFLRREIPLPYRKNIRTLGRLRDELEEEDEDQSQPQLGHSDEGEGAHGHARQKGVHFIDSNESSAPTMVVVHEERLPTIRYPSRVTAPQVSTTTSTNIHQHTAI